MATGNNLRVQFGREATYGTGVVPTKALQVSSESLKLNLTKKEEGLLTGGKLTGRTAAMGRKIDGNISFLVRPDDIGLPLGCLLGKEADAVLVPTSTGAYKHVFTAAGTELLPSMTFVLDRVVKIFEYSGCKVNSISFSAASEDYLKVDMALAGFDEDDGALAPALVPSTAKAFRFANASVKVGGVTLDVTSINFEYNNNLDTSTQTTTTGERYKEPAQQAREIKADLEVLYDDDSNDIRDDFFLTDATCALEINFVGGEIETGFNYALKISIPHCQVEDASPNVGGPERIKYNLQLKAIEGGSGEPITVELINAYNGEYLS
jgi:hypothetical protein